jgi:hypothetical protein
VIIAIQIGGPQLFGGTVAKPIYVYGKPAFGYDVTNYSSLPLRLEKKIPSVY